MQHILSLDRTFATKNESYNLLHNDALDWKEELVIIGLADSLLRRKQLFSSLESTTYKHPELEKYERCNHILPSSLEENRVYVTTDKKDICLESRPRNINKTCIEEKLKLDPSMSSRGSFTWHNDAVDSSCRKDTNLFGILPYFTMSLTKFDMQEKDKSLHHILQGTCRGHFCSASRLQPKKKRSRSIIKSKRKKSYIRFTPEEEMNLRIGISQFGVGRWKNILYSYPFHPKRTCVDLKDKYRNMLIAYRKRQCCEVFHSTSFW
ncbi:hypothetical protein Gasu2_17440 [Galdieria sulphuraria]|uniref:DNA-binding protein n=1 Tax=Galdieria sulphuraria TaxID=130081 RepID=M2VTP0_GALSU|nr:DNA-binding protein [Galdieria sulphuraria]EME26576.1 DNA-binding protein [Galdieria sulphuraria]GJD07381.1 hypothetical protein Gasu2_17440 [Galdieria sulphuraria]|eukprot:XP_005703096.1 DNA-binding protein [Galdieria sulphuraria]